MDPLLDKALHRLAPFVAFDMDYERWCAAFGLDPRSKDSERRFQKLLDLYPVVWKAMGDPAFTIELQARMP